MEETKDEIREDMDTGEKEETVYDETGREKLVEDAEISPEEAGFMEGAEDDGEQGKCANCGAALMGAENTFETKLEGKTYWFCSEKCLTDYKEKKKGEGQLS
jgi:YHS domain-containing protein